MKAAPKEIYSLEAVLQCLCSTEQAYVINETLLVLCRCSPGTLHRAAELKHAGVCDGSKQDLLLFSEESHPAKHKLDQRMQVVVSRLRKQRRGCWSANRAAARGWHAHFELQDQFKCWHSKVLWVLMTLFYILDLPSGEAQYKGAWVGRALWTPSTVLPARESGLSHCCPEGNVTRLCRTLLSWLLFQMRRQETRGNRTELCVLVPATCAHTFIHRETLF